MNASVHIFAYEICTCILFSYLYDFPFLYNRRTRM